VALRRAAFAPTQVRAFRSGASRSPAPNATRFSARPFARETELGRDGTFGIYPMPTCRESAHRCGEIDSLGALALKIENRSRSPELDSAVPW
jgi:hypothetical protein